MSDLFHIKEIERKGRGVVATEFIKKGTLILEEGPQIPKIETQVELDNLLSTLAARTMTYSEEKKYLEREFKSNPGMILEFQRFVEKVMSHFNRLSTLDQKGYLDCKTPIFGGLKAIISSIEEDDQDRAEIMLKVVSLYLGHN